MLRQSHHTLKLTAITLSAFAALPASGQTINENFKLVASDADPLDMFGWTVAISGTTAIVATHWDNAPEIDSGSAYLFDTVTGQQIAKLTASDTTPYQYFGSSAAISGTTAIIGARYDNDMGYRSGSAYLFDTETGQEIVQLTASDAANEDHFGQSVAISGTTAIVGADGNDIGGWWAGSAYLFDIISGQEIARLTPSDAGLRYHFGRSVAISNTTAIVGAYWGDIPGSISLSGTAYLFDAKTGQQIAKLTASDAATSDQFGISVAISGTTAIIGANGNDDHGNKSGSAYLFDTVTGQQIVKLTASDAATDDQFGISVAISGTTAIIGAYGNNDHGSLSGSAYIFDTITGQQIAKLSASDADAHDGFGWAVAISGTTAIVGARGNDDAGSRSGSAYLFDLAPILSCPIDFDNNGTLDILDIFAYLDVFTNGDMAADLTGDGELNIFDVFAYLNLFNAGCP